jgi:dUTP pyrophosphatase
VKEVIVMEEVKIYKLSDEAILPIYGTSGSACFDLYACLDCEEVKVFDKTNAAVNGTVFNRRFNIRPGDRALIPTGLVFDLAPTQNLRVHPRSSIAIKFGLTLANAEGIIDSDYVHQTYISLFNISDVDVEISHGDRIAQGEIVKTNRVNLVESYVEPSQKTDRVGGVGSTGR